MSNYAKTAKGILDAVGGEANVQTLVHCATRLRFVLADSSKADRAATRAVPGVLTVNEAAGEYQVVIGNEVPEVFAEIGKISGLGASNANGAARPGAATGGSRNPLVRLVATISAVFSPLLWALASVGLLKAFVSASNTFGWINPESPTFTILNAISDAFIYFLPMALAISAAKHFGAQQYVSLAIAGALEYPTIVALAGKEGLDFFGIPAIMVSYTYGIIPILVAVWLQSHLERILYAKLPAMVRRFVTPMVVLVVMVPLVFLVIGPIASAATVGVSGGVFWVFETVPWLGGALMGGLWQVMILLGVNAGFVPIFLAEYQQYGYGLLLAPMWAAVLAQTGAVIGVWTRTKSSSRRALAGSASVSGLLAGVTEPAIYGVNLPLRRPFLFGLLGGAIGGAIISGAGVAVNVALVFPSILSIPALTGHGDFVFAIVGILVAMAVGFLGTVVWFREADEEAALVTEEASDFEVHSPLDGTAVPLSDVADPAFATNALGHGAAILPTGNTLYAPFDGEVLAVFPTGHAVGLRHPNGAEVLIHIGLNTVQLNGKHFSVKVEQGHQVKAGDPLVTFDRDAIVADGYDLTTPIVVTNATTYPTVGLITTGAIRHGEPLFIAVASQHATVA